ncbi:MAG TPA: hypothetical protein VIL20_22330 [Sandaracinaceae bacterium]
MTAPPRDLAVAIGIAIVDGCQGRDVAALASSFVVAYLGIARISVGLVVVAVVSSARHRVVAISIPIRSAAHVWATQRVCSSTHRSPSVQGGPTSMQPRGSAPAAPGTHRQVVQKSESSQSAFRSH